MKFLRMSKIILDNHAPPSRIGGTNGETDMIKVKILLKNSRPQNQWLTFDKEYFVIDEYETIDNKWVTVVVNDLGDDTDLHDGEFEVIE